MTSTMILAAGRGTRLQELTADTPKPLVPVAGVKPLRRTLGLLAYRGYSQTVVNAWYLADKIKKEAESVQNPLVTVIEESNLLDTGGGIKNALSHLGTDPFLVINGDLIWSEEATPILAQLPGMFDPEKMDALLVLIPLEHAQGYTKQGDFFMEEGGRLRLRQPDDGPAPYVYGCIQILHPRAFVGHDSSAFPLTDVYKTAASQGRLYGVEYTGEWADMGTPEGMQAAGRILGRIGSATVA